MRATSQIALKKELYNGNCSVTPHIALLRFMRTYEGDAEAAKEGGGAALPHESHTCGPHAAQRGVDC